MAATTNSQLDHPPSTSSTTTPSTSTISHNDHPISSSSVQSLDLLETDEIKRILKSDQSLDILLYRLKQSITTAEEFCKYLKKKAQIEEDYFNQSNRFAINIRGNFKHLQGKVKDDSFTSRLDEIIEFDQKISQVGLSYVSAITTMFNELTKLSDVVSKNRKVIKDEGRRKEKDCIDSIIAAEKAKLKYGNLCEDLEKLKAMDPNKKQTFTLKNKSLEQQEQDLKIKIDGADQDYKMKVATCKRSKDELVLSYRPSNSRKLKDLILELDMAMNFQLQKFSTWNESLIINTGILINPLQNNKQSMKAIASSIDNGKDLYNYLLKQQTNAVKINKSLVPIEYVQHHSQIRSDRPSQFVINKQNTYSNNNNNNTTNNGSNFDTSTTVTGNSYHTAINSNNNNYNSLLTNNSTLTSTVSPPHMNLSNSEPTGPKGPVPLSVDVNNDNFPRHETVSSSVYNDSPIDSTQPLRTLDPLSSTTNTPQIPSLPAGPLGLPSPNIALPAPTSAPPQGLPAPTPSLEPSFGVPLDVLIQHAGKDNVPSLVIKCIEIIEKYGLDIEGIYRTSPNKLVVDNLKELVDQKYSNCNLLGSNIDPHNVLDAEIFSIASLLKNFFVNIPDGGLLTDNANTRFINIVKNVGNKSSVEVDAAIHRLIFELPDSSYYTLRYLLFHLDKVASMEATNKMNFKNLSIIWGPVILNQDSHSHEDLSFKSLVIEKFLLNAHNIFYDGDGDGNE
ncbi:Rgd1 GTPase activator protein [Scheffersomyces coipomensis]|uniref:Rgd1 GTPase activator protein n=1 Tax=Scheffersomyces coipomensis TaxID=1788519 RepID=UPI00315D4FBC